MYPTSIVHTSSAHCDPQTINLYFRKQVDLLICVVSVYVRMYVQVWECMGVDAGGCCRVSFLIVSHLLYITAEILSGLNLELT